MAEKYRLVLKDIEYKYLSEEAKKIKRKIENPEDIITDYSSYSKRWSERLTELFNNIYEALASNDDSRINNSIEELNKQMSIYWSLLKDIGGEQSRKLRNVLYKANSKFNKVKKYLKEVSK